MIVCRSCGSRNGNGDTFCGSCGEFLEWAGEPAAGAEAAPVGPIAPPDPSRPAPAAPAAPPAAPGDPAHNRLESPSAPEARRSFPQPRAPAEPVPEQPPNAQPAAMRPQQAQRPPPAVRAQPAPPTRQRGPDDLICGDCGEGNPPTRRFCSRCGASLHEAVVVPRPWWRRLSGWRDRRRAAGSRPRRRSVGSSAARGVRVLVRRGLAAAVLLAGLLYAVAPPVRGWVNREALGATQWVQSLISSQFVPVHPTSTSATAQLRDHPARLATDGVTNTFWVAPDGAAQPTLVLGFDRPVGLARAIVRVGGGQDFQAFGRPERLHLVFSTGRSTDLTLQDTPEEQEVDLHGGAGVTSVEIHVVSVYRSVRNRGMALTEIELFDRR